MPRIKIGLTFIAIFGLLALGGNSIWFTGGLFMALVIHEISHILASRLFGYQVSRINLTIFGGCLAIDPLFGANPNAETVIAAAGPAINFLMALGVGYLGFLGIGNDYLRYWQQLNLLMGAVNLLPVYPLDGGRIIHAWLVKTGGLKTAARVARIIAFGAALFFLISGIVQIVVKTGGPAFIIMGLFILFHWWNCKTPEMNLIWQIRRHKRNTLRKKGFLNSKIVVVEPRTPLRLPLQHYGTDEYLLFFIEDGRRNFRLTSEDQAWNILFTEGCQATFNEIAKKESQ